jgi:hypothetical protein
MALREKLDMCHKLVGWGCGGGMLPLSGAVSEVTTGQTSIDPTSHLDHVSAAILSHSIYIRIQCPFMVAYGEASQR